MRLAVVRFALEVRGVACADTLEARAASVNADPTRQRAEQCIAGSVLRDAFLKLGDRFFVETAGQEGLASRLAMDDKLILPSSHREN